MALRRGFKSQCERRAVEIRRAFDLPPDAPLSASLVADQLRVHVWTERDILNLPTQDLHQLTVSDADSWSAFVIRVEGEHLVVLNSTQSVARKNSVLMHELSHIMLGHELSSASLTVDGFFVPTTYNQDEEDEANWLAGALLLPRPALLASRRLGWSDPTIMEKYFVSGDMLIWRTRVTGIDYQLARL